LVTGRVPNPEHVLDKPEPVQQSLLPRREKIKAGTNRADRLHIDRAHG